MVVCLVHDALTTLAEKLALPDVGDDYVVDTRRLLLRPMVRGACDDSGGGIVKDGGE